MRGTFLVADLQQLVETLCASSVPLVAAIFPGWDSPFPTIRFEDVRLKMRRIPMLWHLQALIDAWLYNMKRKRSSVEFSSLQIAVEERDFAKLGRSRGSPCQAINRTGIIAATNMWGWATLAIEALVPRAISTDNVSAEDFVVFGSFNRSFNVAF
jgi:hypothetical protein